MARYKFAGESQAAQLAGAPVTTTFNGFFAAVEAGASANFKLRRVILGVRAGASVPTSQQMTIAVFRQTAAASGSGSALNAGIAMDPRSAATAIGGLRLTTAATAGTSGPTLAANAMDRFSFNTQSALDIPSEFLEEYICDTGTANGIAFVNIGNALPAAHLFTIGVEWEE